MRNGPDPNSGQSFPLGRRFATAGRISAYSRARPRGWSCFCSIAWTMPNPRASSHRSDREPHLSLLACVRSRREGGADLRVPRQWAARTGRWASLRSLESAARSIWPRRGRAEGLHARCRQVPRRQHGRGNEERRRRFVQLRLEGDQPFAGPRRGRSSMRCTCAVHAQSQFRRTREHARHLRGADRQDPLSSGTGHHRGELLPVFAFDAQDCPRGLVNYWGYQPVSFFAPHAAYSSRRDPAGPVDEFRDMVKALHRAGIEVILDVVFNHTSRASTMGRRCASAGWTIRRITFSTVIAHATPITAAAATRSTRTTRSCGG